MKANVFSDTIKFIISDLILDILYFPIWWYSKGIKKTLLFVLRQVKERSEDLALKILIVNLFKPMYGDYSLSGRVISFFARIVHLTIRLILMLIWLALMLVLFTAWLAIPVLVIYQIILHLV